MGLKYKICEILGGVTAVADICGVTPGAVSQWDEEDIPFRHLRTVLDHGKQNHIHELAPEVLLNSPTN